MGCGCGAASPLVNVTLAALRVAIAALDGSPLLVEEDAEAARRVACATCPQLRRLPLLGGQCRACGCVLEVKRRLATERCPLGHWQA